MAPGSSSTAFFDKTYNDALALTEEAYAYLCQIDRNEIVTESPIEDLRLRGEAFRLTTRLMQVVAWLLTQRAIHAGELSAPEVAAGAQYRLGASRVCRDPRIFFATAFSMLNGFSSVRGIRSKLQPR